MTGDPPVRRLLLVGGGGGLVGRHVLTEFLPTWKVRSVHRHPAGLEAGSPVEWIPADIATFPDWSSVLGDVDAIVNVAWYRAGRAQRFQDIHDGLLRLLDAARRADTPRFVQISVPAAPPQLEATLPYLTFKRRFDQALSGSGISYRILRPTMLFAPNDVLVTVMMRAIWRYRMFPMFGDGGYHISPIAAPDLARALRLAAEGKMTGTSDLGGPARYRYRDVTDLLFRSLGRRERYWRMSASGGARLARTLERVGSHLLYAYEVDWLVSDMLGLPPYDGLDRPMARLESFVDEEARKLTGRRTAEERNSLPG